MKNHQKTNSAPNDIVLENINDPELQHIIADVMSYTEEYDIPLDYDSFDL